MSDCSKTERLKNRNMSHSWACFERVNAKWRTRNCIWRRGLPLYTISCLIPLFGLLLRSVERSWSCLSIRFMCPGVINLLIRITMLNLLIRVTMLFLLHGIQIQSLVPAIRSFHWWLIQTSTLATTFMRPLSSLPRQILELHGMHTVNTHFCIS